MYKSFNLLRVSRKTAVSEVLGTLLLLVMTVAFFSVIILWVYGFDTPESESRVNLFPQMDRLDSVSANVTITHRGGEPIIGSSVQIIMEVQNVSNGTRLFGPFNLTDGMSGESEWKVGMTWARVFDTVPKDAQVDLRVVDRLNQALLLDTELQRGLAAGGNATPIVGVPVILEDWEVVADGSDDFYLRAVAVDYDNDLPNDGLVADLTPIWPGMASVILYHVGFGIYESSTQTVPLAAIPGEYTLNVTATDNKGHSDTNWAAIKVVSPDRDPPSLLITHPTSGELAAGTANRVVATYADSNGIDTSSVTLDVWEDDVPLDTSSKTVTDTMVTFYPFGGFTDNVVYRINVSVCDNNGNRAYAETVFRTATYSQPGNPQGETSFDVMNKAWVSTTEFEHDDYIRVQIWSEVIKQVDDSELRLTQTDSSDVFIYKDRFAPNLTVPPYSESFPFYVYDGTIYLETDGAYGGKVPPGYYTLKLVATYNAGGVEFEDEITVVVKYEDGSMPDVGFFWLYNETGKWSSSTRTFDYQEMCYIEVVTENPLERGRTSINKAMVSISDIYGDNIFYREIPDTEITYAGTGHGGYLYRMTIDLSATIGGSQWFYGANWYPIEVVIQTKTWHRFFFFWRWWSYDIEFEAGDQMKIIRPADIAIFPDELLVYHEDGTTVDNNATLRFGENLYINVTIWNLADVDITNARCQVWAVSGGVTLDYWDLTTDAFFWDPNGNDMIDNDDFVNYVTTNITWNTSKTGYDQTTLNSAKIVVHIDIISPVIAGYGSDPVPEVDYNNNDAEKRLLPASEGELTVTDLGYTTPSDIDLGEAKVLMDRLRFTAQNGGVRVTNVTVRKRGLVQDSDIEQVYLYEDSNLNGRLDLGDRLVDSGPMASGQFKGSDSKFLQDGNSIVYMFVYDISDTAVVGRTCGCRLRYNTDIEVEAPATVPDVGFPFNSELGTIRSNQNRLDGSASGSSNAFAGSPVWYTCDLSAENLDGGKAGQGSLTITTIVVHVTGSTEVDSVMLFDDDSNLIASQPSAAIVSFNDLSYVVSAAANRDLYVVLDLKDTAADGSVVGFSILAADVQLSCLEDTVEASLSLVRTSTVRTMAWLFEWKTGDPQFDGSDESVIQNMNVGITQDAEVHVEGITVTWSSSSRPAYTLRIYVDGGLCFEDDGVNHKNKGDYIPFINPVELTTGAKSFRIEFNQDVIRWSFFGGWSDNDITFTWYFTDGSTSDGGQFIEIIGHWGSYDIHWA